jgi:hypothetical protein
VYFVELRWVFNQTIALPYKRVVGVFVRFSCAASVLGPSAHSPPLPKRGRDEKGREGWARSFD